MAFFSRVPTVVMAPFMISACAVSVALLFRAFVRMKLRDAVLFFSEARIYGILDKLTTVASAFGNVNAAREEEGAYVDVILNWNNAESLRIPALLFDENQFDMLIIFDIYSGLSRNSHPDKLLLCDSWNCLIAVVTHNLRKLLREDSALLLDEAKTEEIFALCTLLREKYAISKLITLRGCALVIQEFPEELFQHLLSIYYKRRSLRLGLLSFIKLVYNSCSVPRLIMLVSIVLLSPDTILKTVVGLQGDLNWVPLYVSEMGKTLTLGLLPSEYSVFQFISDQFRGAPGALAAIAVASIGPVELLRCFRSFAISYILMDIVMTFHVSAYLALATADYNSDANWPLSRSVSHALWHISSSVSGELQSHMSRLLEIVCSCWVAIRFPAMALSMWLGTQWNDFVNFISESLYLESQYAKSYFVLPEFEFEEDESKKNQIYRADRRHFPGDQLGFSSPIHLLMKKESVVWGKRRVTGEEGVALSLQSCSLGEGGAPQHGLTLLLLVCTDLNLFSEPPWVCLLQHLSWPVAPIGFVEHIVYTLEKASQSNGSAIGLQRLQWVRTIIKNMLTVKGSTSYGCNAQYWREYLQGFMTFRQGGIELAVAKSVVEGTFTFRNDRREDFIRDLLFAVFRTASAMPLLLTSLVVLYTPQGYLEQTSLEQGDTMSHLQFIQHLFPIFPTLVGFFYEECGFSEARVDLARLRRHLELSRSSFGCYQVLEELKSVQHRIDRPLTSPPPSLDGPWSVEFCSVSFRYSEHHSFTLWRVSFKIEKGSFLGIAGYSGAGKTTLLRLLNRTYAPTSGEIFINDYPISRYPPRALRRRMANIWQEENKFRLFDHLSIASNVAFGNLWTSSSADINSALSAAQALSFVEGRSLGIYSPLRPQEFSGGEVERLCIARALMKRNSEVGLYALDEATSAIDTRTEEMIFDSLGLNKGSLAPRQSTFVVVAHRLATLKRADMILVLNDGKVDQIGRWEELCKSGSDSCFLKMFKSQQLSPYALQCENNENQPTTTTAASVKNTEARGAKD